MPGVFLGIGEHGKVKHAVDAGDDITCLTVEVLSCEFFHLYCYCLLFVLLHLLTHELLLHTIALNSGRACLC